jgi:hypothetical protein
LKLGIVMAPEWMFCSGLLWRFEVFSFVLPYVF